MKEYGGYIEFEHYSGKEYHQNVLALNSGRNCLAHLMDVRKIKKIYLPYFLCSSVSMICKKMGVEIEYYGIDEQFQPIFSKNLAENEYLYIVNFYGQLDRHLLLDLKRKHNYIIVDNVQAFFEKPIEGIDTIYVPRKFFGVADGAYLATDCKIAENYPQDISCDKMEYLLGRFEGSASQYYDKFRENDENFNTASIKFMSALTHNLLRGIDYESVKVRREENFKYLHSKLNKMNILHVHMPIGPFAYPLLIEDGYILRQKLQQNKIYIPTLWPNVLEECESSSLEYRYARDILPIPIDQRYNLSDMEYIAEQLQKLVAPV